MAMSAGAVRRHFEDLVDADQSFALQAARSILETFATLQMVDVHLPTTDGRQLVLPRHTRPNREHDLLLHQLQLQLPTQPAPRITT